jgi:Flp pilus assembly protein TadG
MKNLMRLFKGKSSEKGQSLVEMALVVLLFFFILFGILEFSRALWTYNTIIHSTRAAARWAVVNAKVTAYNSGTGVYTIDSADLASVKNVAVYGDPTTSSGNPVALGLNTSMVTVTIKAIEQDALGNALNKQVTVDISGFQFQFIVPIAPNITIPAYQTTLYTESLGATS